MYIPLTEMKIISITLILAFGLVSCTSYKAVKPLDHSYSDLREGDTVRIVTKDGRKVKFKVTTITLDAIVDENQRVLFSDITTLERQQISIVKSVGLVAGVLGALGALVVFSIAFGGTPKGR